MPTVAARRDTLFSRSSQSVSRPCHECARGARFGVPWPMARIRQGAERPLVGELPDRFHAATFLRKTPGTGSVGRSLDDSNGSAMRVRRGSAITDNMLSNVGRCFPITSHSPSARRTRTDAPRRSTLSQRSSRAIGGAPGALCRILGLSRNPVDANFRRAGRRSSRPPIMPSKPAAPSP
jgi:hypothetical protein